MITTMYNAYMGKEIFLKWKDYGFKNYLSHLKLFVIILTVH